MHADNMSKKVVKVVSILFVLIMLLTLLIACDAQTYKHRLENKGYTVYYTAIDEDSIKEFASLSAQLKSYGLSVDDLKWVMMAADQVKGEDAVTIYHFKDKKSADTFYTKYKEQLIGKEGYIEIDKKDVFYGTEQGIKDARNR